MKLYYVLLKSKSKWYCMLLILLSRIVAGLGLGIEMLIMFYSMKKKKNSLKN